MKTFSRVALGALAAGLVAAPALASERVVNGDFSAGFAGFATTYTEIPPGTENDATGDLLIVQNPTQLGCGGCFPSINDHTTGTGNLLFVDGAGAFNQVIWSETVAVVPNANYLLSFWTTSLGKSGPIPDVAVSVNGNAAIDTGSLPYSDFNNPAWLNFSQTVNAGAANTMTISFTDLTVTHAFNDLALDDISLTGPSPAGGAPEPAAWALMIAGFGLAGAALRRRAAIA